MGELVDFIVGLQKSRKAREGQPKIRVSLDAGSIIGHLTILSLVRRSTNSVVTYNCLCECGNEVELNYNQIKKREKADEGCLLPKCSISKEEDQVFTDLESCLKDQFRRLHVYCEDQLDELWGGQESILDLPSAFEYFCNHVKKLGATEDNGKWWIYRINKSHPYEIGNIKLGKSNSIAGTVGEHVFLYEDDIISIEEAAEILDCTEEDILTLQDAMISDEEIIESLI